jgi:hypothetical protein
MMRLTMQLPQQQKQLLAVAAVTDSSAVAVAGRRPAGARLLLPAPSDGRRWTSTAL